MVVSRLQFRSFSKKYMLGCGLVSLLPSCGRDFSSHMSANATVDPYTKYDSSSVPSTEKRRMLLKQAAYDNDIEAFRTLLAQGANIEALDEQQTILHNAAKEGKIDAIRILLRAGADKEAISPDGTPLAIAIRNRQVGVVKMLLAACANQADPTVLPFTTKKLKFSNNKADREILDLFRPHGNTCSITSSASRNTFFVKSGLNYLSASVTHYIGQAHQGSGNAFGYGSMGTYGINSALLSMQYLWSYFNKEGLRPVAETPALSVTDELAYKVDQALEKAKKKGWG